MSIHSYIRALSVNHWDVDSALLSSEVEVALPGEDFMLRADGTNLDFDFASNLTAGQITTLDNSVVAHKTSGRLLQLAKDEKIIEVDRRTEELIGLGFVYSAKQFSLSLAAQSKMTAAHEIKDEIAFVYPVAWNTIDDNSVYSILNAMDLHNFYMTAIGTIRARLDSGTSIKDTIRAAVDVAAVNAVVDGR